MAAHRRLSTRVLLTEEQIHQRVEALARAIAADTPEGEPLSVVALMDGAFMFCADLVRRLPMPVHLAFVPVRSIERGGHPERIVFSDDIPLRQRDVLIVEDILDTGRTLEAITHRVAREGPRRVRLAVLLDKPARRAIAVRADYRGFTIEDQWVVGYGLDWNGLYRNLPYISFIE